MLREDEAEDTHCLIREVNHLIEPRYLQLPSIRTRQGIKSLIIRFYFFQALQFFYILSWWQWVESVLTTWLYLKQLLLPVAASSNVRQRQEDSFQWELVGLFTHPGVKGHN